MVFVISKCNNFINLPLRFAQQSRLFSVSWHPQFCKDQISLRQKQHLRESLTIKGGLTCRSQSGPFHSPHHLIRTQLESEDLPLYNFERTSDSMCHPEKVKKIRNMHKMISGKWEVKFWILFLWSRPDSQQEVTGLSELAPLTHRLLTRDESPGRGRHVGDGVAGGGGGEEGEGLLDVPGVLLYLVVHFQVQEEYRAAFTIEHILRLDNYVGNETI